MNVSKPLENVLNSVSDLKHITSQSRENISIITLEFDYGTDIDVATNDVRDKLDVAEPMLPDDCDIHYLQIRDERYTDYHPFGYGGREHERPIQDSGR